MSGECFLCHALRHARARYPALKSARPPESDHLARRQSGFTHFRVISGMAHCYRGLIPPFPEAPCTPNNIGGLHRAAGARICVQFPLVPTPGAVRGAVVFFGVFASWFLDPPINYHSIYCSCESVRSVCFVILYLFYGGADFLPTEWIFGNFAYLRMYSNRVI